MLPKSKSRGSQGFTASLAIANMRLPGMRRVGILLHVQSRILALVLLTTEHYGHAQFPGSPLLGDS
jgi:hypothetical protein